MGILNLIINTSMEAYRGVILYRNPEPIFYGSVLPRQETQIATRYEKKAWPKNGSNTPINSAHTKNRIRTQSSAESEKKFTGCNDSLFRSDKTKSNITGASKKRPTSAKVEI